MSFTGRFLVMFAALFGGFIVEIALTALMVIGWVCHPLLSIAGAVMAFTWAYFFVVAMYKMIDWVTH